MTNARPVLAMFQRPFGLDVRHFEKAKSRRKSKMDFGGQKDLCPETEQFCAITRRPYAGSFSREPANRWSLTSP
jgi:hypothetical protein